MNDEIKKDLTSNEEGASILQTNKQTNKQTGILFTKCHSLTLNNATMINMLAE